MHFLVSFVLVYSTNSVRQVTCLIVKIEKIGYICRYQKALYFGSLGISLYLELFCFLSFISFVLRKLTQSVLRYLQKDPKNW